MVLFFIADLALSLAFKLSAWCLGKTYNGIVYLVTYKSHPQKSNAYEAMSDDDCTDDCVIILSRQEYDALKQSHDLPHHHNGASSEDALVSSSSEGALLSSSK
jgi:hypothetical protein